MKYLDEYRDAKLVKEYIDRIKETVTRPWTIMEVCGGQTHSLVRNGILEMLPEEVTMVHGPGCPVCVTPLEIIDQALYLAGLPGVILCSFGDMLRVPGSSTSLLEAKADGCDIRIVYSPLEAVKLAAELPDKKVIFFGVGFETTAPAVSLSVVQALQLGLKNYFVLASHVLVPPAMEAILSDENCVIDGFLAAGHVCTIMGVEEYYPIAEKYNCPIVVTGFEPVDLVQGIYMTVKQLEEGRYEVENQYARVVRNQGNASARHTIGQVYDASDRKWRGIGNIPSSGYELKAAFKAFDAKKHFRLDEMEWEKDKGICIAGEIMKGFKKPHDCPNFATNCKPESPLGAPMVSSEGVCSAYYYYAKRKEESIVLL